MFPFEFTALEMKNIFYNICKSKRGKYIKKKKKAFFQIYYHLALSQNLVGSLSEG